MKKQLISIIPLIIFGLVGCDSNQSSSIKSSSSQHSHSYESTWSFDENNHWHNSTCGHEDGDFGEHSFNGTNTCSVCGYTKTYMNYYLSKVTQSYSDGEEIETTINYDVGTRTYERTFVSTMNGEPFYDVYTKYVYNDKGLCTYSNDNTYGTKVELYYVYDEKDVLIKDSVYYDDEFYKDRYYQYDGLNRLSKRTDVIPATDIGDEDSISTMTYSYYDGYYIETITNEYYSFVNKYVESMDEIEGTKTITCYRIDNSEETFYESFTYSLETGDVVAMNSLSGVGYTTFNENGDILKVDYDGTEVCVFETFGDFYYDSNGVITKVLYSDYDYETHELVEYRMDFVHDENGNVIEEKTYNLTGDSESLYLTTTYEIREIPSNVFVPDVLEKASRKGNYKYIDYSYFRIPENSIACDYTY